MSKNRLLEIFSQVFEVDIKQVPEIEYQSVPEWDSIGHMMMISEVEDAFGISIEMDDVINISNFDECLEVVNKYSS